MITPRETLLARRAELTTALDAIETDLDTPANPDWDDNATERQGDEVLEALGTAELRELQQIDAALDRVTAGTYGTCLSCGDPISPERLAVLPATPKCKTCAAKAA